MASLLIVHGGGPTAVINGSLYGAVMAAKADGTPAHIYGAIGGTEGVLNERFFDFKTCRSGRLETRLQTPGSAIGSSRTPLQNGDYEKMAEIFRKHDIRWVLLNGGNGTMDTCAKLAKACEGAGVSVVGIPKTIDNDIPFTDHAPGFGSAARYLAATVREITEDVRSLPIHVCIVEAMGRDAGWITAAAALAGQAPGEGPDLLYVPERPFSKERFLSDVERLYREKGEAVVVASEGLKDETGAPVVPPVFQVGRATYFGDVSAYLAELVIRELGVKARSEKPGLAGRASVAWQSDVDLREAVAAGAKAAEWALEGRTGVMVGLERESGKGYGVTFVPVDLSAGMLSARCLPDCYVNARGNGVTESFCAWCRPLLGEAFPDFFHLPHRAGGTNL